MIYLVIAESEWFESKFKNICLCEDASRLNSYIDIAFTDGNKSELSTYDQSDNITIAANNIAKKLIASNYNVTYLGQVSADYKDIYQIIVKLK